MAKKTILQSGTFDVDNYGDLLFPLIAEFHLRELDITQRLVSPVGGTTSFRDVPLSFPLSAFSNEDLTCHAALIGGGNIIHSDSHTVKDYEVNDSNFFAYSDLWIAPLFLYPTRLPIIWNAPGVPMRFPKEFVPLVEKVLRRVDCLTVRDSASAEYLLEVYPQAQIRIVPDSAWTLNKLWPADELQKEFTTFLQNFGCASDTQTLAVHLNSRYLGGASPEQIAKLLDEAARDLGLKIMLLPIGMCHGDDELAVEVSREMRSEPIVLAAPNSLKQIASCIAGSVFYLGSSMHGLITASVYSVPGICVSRRANHKFLELEKRIDCGEIITESWPEGISLLRKTSLSAWKARLTEVSRQTQSELETHWSKIRELISKAEPVTISKEIFAHALGEYRYSTLLAQVKYKDSQRASERIKAAELTERREADRQKISSLTETIERSDSERRFLEKERKELERTLEQRTMERQSLQQQKARTEDLSRSFARQLEAKEQQLRGILTSKSWRITAPLRYITELAKRGITQYGRTASNAVLPPPQAPKEAIHHPSTAQEIHETRVTLHDEALEARVKEYLEKTKQIKDKKVVVYTSILDNYDMLTTPLHLNPEWDYVCFTDRKEFQGTHPWKVRHIDYFDKDSARMARFIKLHPEMYLSEYQYSIWVDANILIRDSFIETALAALKETGCRFGAISHPHRKCAYEEAETCKELNKDDTALINQQISFYKKEGLPQGFGLIETGVLIREHNTPEVKELSRVWWNEINRFSRRDQISLMYAIWKTSFAWQPILPKGFSTRDHHGFYLFRHGLKASASRPRYMVPSYLPRAFYEENLPCWMSDITPFNPQCLEQYTQEAIDIVICVHNAREDVARCVESVLLHLLPSHTVILVDDGSEVETAELLRTLQSRHQAIRLIRHDTPRGYTTSANVGLGAGAAKFKILLNSDTIVTAKWALKLLHASKQNPRIGVVGPLSNAASWQSLPFAKDPETGKMAINSLPEGKTPEDLNRFCEVHGNYEHLPKVPLVNGFCFGITQELLDTIGYFDSEAFPQGYGEEDDFTQRAIDAGFIHSIATHTYVYHAKSKSFGSERRAALAKQGGTVLRERYGKERIARAVDSMIENPFLARMRSACVKEYGLNTLQSFKSSLEIPEDLSAYTHKEIHLTGLRNGYHHDSKHSLEPAKETILALLPRNSAGYQDSAYTRLIHPFNHPKIKESCRLIPCTLEEIFRTPSSTVVVHQTAISNPDHAINLVSFCKSRGIKLVYEVAEDFFNPETLDSFQKNVKRSAEVIAHLADFVVVASPLLGLKLRRLNSHTRTLPSVLNENLLEAAKEFHATTQAGILYVAKESSPKEEEIARSALEQIKNKYGTKVCINVIGAAGACANAPFIERLDLPSDAIEYPGFMKWLNLNRDRWSIALMPLLDSTFNNSKSYSRYLDLCSLGLAVVCSEVSPYTQIVQDSATGLLCKNTPESWTRAVGRLVEDELLLKSIRENSYQNLLAEHTMSTKYQDFLDIYLK